MIFLLTERAMNGTVTMSIRSIGIDAKSADKAFEKLTKFENWHLAKNISETDEAWSYSMASDTGFDCWGYLSKKPFKVV